MRRTLGGLTVLGALWLVFQANPFSIIIGVILGIGGLIAMFSRNPEQSLATGTCDKCWKPDKLLAWNCQRGGCWAQNCSDCESIGDDPIETYAKTLGAVALGVVLVGVAAIAVVAVAEGGGGGLVGFPSSRGEEAEKKSTKIDMLLCRECTSLRLSQRTI